MRCNIEGRLTRVFGYKGKQVRDNIHSLDVARFIHAFWERPALRRGLQYRRRPGKQLSILEAFDRIAAAISGK